MSIYLHYLHHKMGLGTAEIYRCYPQYPKDHSLLAHEAGRWGGCRRQSPQKFGAKKKNNCLWLSEDHRNIAKFKEICWHVFVQIYSGGCRHECNNFKQLSDVSCMSMAVSTTNMQKKGSPDYWRPPVKWFKFSRKCNALLLNFWTKRISFLSWWD